MSAPARIIEHIWPTEPQEETRQHYANVRLAEWQRAWVRVERVPPFTEVLRAFREYGLQYDAGNRLPSLASLDGAA